ncbi:MAG TPA: lysophospholipid acyltransferase family protein [Bacteroidales bacterium]|nr:lysophospholipid acyltransferase family protein [Bacteroidales bacterium]
MSKLGYYIFYGFIWLITLLPLNVLYIFSNILFFILYYFPSYRRKVVQENLRNSFPEKTEEDLRYIERKYYRHLADLFIETLKVTHMSEKQMKKHFILKNPELLERLHREKRDIIAVLGHYNNWEWLNIFSAQTDYKTISIYKPLHNSNFDNFINKLRSKYGMVLTPMSAIIREIINDRKNNTNSISAFLSDQVPIRDDIKYWTNFLNQDTPVYLGAEKIASRFDMAVVFFNIQKIKRGYYELTVELLFEHTSGLPEYLITDTHVKRLEEVIQKNPEYWIWSHRRWKHKRPSEYA